jgi:DNA polymerase-3 subunit alpha
MDRIVGESSHTHEAAAVGQMSLFGGPASGNGLRIEADLLKDPSKLKKIDNRQLLDWEKDALGVHVSEHPLERPLALLEKRTNAVISDLHDQNFAGKSVRVAGVVSHLRKLTTKKGDPMAFATLEDLDEKVDLVIFPRTWEQTRDQVEVDQVMLVAGTVKFRDDQPSLIVDKVITKLESASAADSGAAPFFVDMPPADPPPVNDNKEKPAKLPGAMKKQIENDPQTGSSGPPPPPNFDDNWTGSGSVKANGREETNTEPEPTLVAEKTVVTQGGKTVTVPGNGNHKARTVVVEIKAAGNWRDACRRTLETAKAHSGEDDLCLRIANQDLAMDFPTCATHFCDELVEDIERIPGIVRVYDK